MNDWNHLEMRLRSLTPRRPSERVKTRLFGQPGVTGRRREFSLNWLAPLTASLLFLFVTLYQAGDSLSSRSRPDAHWPVVAMTLSNVSFAAYLPGSLRSGQNSLPADTFEWTKRVHSHSSIPSFRLSETNHVRR